MTVTVASEFFPTPYWAMVVRTPGPWKFLPLHYMVIPMFNRNATQYAHKDRVRLATETFV